MLTLPEALASAYVALTDHHGLREQGLAREKGSGATGGQSRSEQLDYFAKKFDGSSARAMLTILDPESKAGTTSDRILASIAGNVVCMTDAPCGAGAASLGLLCTLSVLREKGVLPRMPLTVRWVGGELSPHAIELSQAMFEAVASALEAQAIFLDRQWIQWNVTDPMSTADLVRASERASVAADMRLLIVANFSSALQRDQRREAARSQLEEVFRYASGTNSAAVWIEPDMNISMDRGGLFSWLRREFKSLWDRMAGPEPESNPDEPAHRCEASFVLPLKPDTTSRVTLAVMPISFARRA
ncbi:MAG TPA: hypothetical protein PLN31_20430 [Azoarcus taiwanensis]|nr:hypothetical protein [Luteimonas sp.]HRP73440.1 hypothetical protein [Luteimonas sp.]HRQ59788.1 hypothetical protein [Azoarcus taiwanensis]